MDIEWIGLEIHPETPLQGNDIFEKFGKRTVELTIQRLNQIGRTFGISFGELKHLPNSNKALQAAEYARSQGRLHDYHELLMKAYFTDGKDIGQTSILVALGQQIGLDKEGLETAIESKAFSEKLTENAKEAQGLNISSTPTFVINDTHIIVGAQSIDTFRQLFSQLKP